jgi:hypothetical protein
MSKQRWYYQRDAVTARHGQLRFLFLRVRGVAKKQNKMILFLMFSLLTHLKISVTQSAFCTKNSRIKFNLYH